MVKYNKKDNDDNNLRKDGVHHIPLFLTLSILER
jgi:hypothetical protein